MKITLRNDFHNSEITFAILEENDYGCYQITDRQVARIRAKLCGVDGCTCGGLRDPDWTLTDYGDGQNWIERTGR